MSARVSALVALLVLGFGDAEAQWQDSLETRPGSYDVLAHQERAMDILLAWGGLSMGSGAVLTLQGSPVARGFGIQNLAWGAIDVGIALWARSSIEEKRLEGYSPEEERESFRRILLINTLLDLVYIAVGVGLMVSGKEHLRGHGIGVTLQGSFLLVSDGVNYLIAGGELRAGMRSALHFPGVFRTMSTPPDAAVVTGIRWTQGCRPDSHQSTDGGCVVWQQ